MAECSLAIEAPMTPFGDFRVVLGLSCRLKIAQQLSSSISVPDDKNKPDGGKGVVLKHFPARCSRLVPAPPEEVRVPLVVMLDPWTPVCITMQPVVAVAMRMRAECVLKYAFVEVLQSCSGISSRITDVLCFSY